MIASIELAQAQVEEVKVLLDNTLIRAPFDGTVLTKNADVGEILTPFAAGPNSRTAVVTIADMHSLQAEVDVAESSLKKIAPGQPCDIELDAYPHQPYPGKVSKIVPTADRAKGTVRVKIKFTRYDEKVPG